jgi:hypothetical protein
MHQSKLHTATGLTAVLFCTMSVLSPAASAQTNPDPGKTEQSQRTDAGRGDGRGRK